MSATKTAKATTACRAFVARPGSTCATCGWRLAAHPHPVVTGLYFRPSTRRNGGEWIAITRQGAVIQNHVLRAVGHDQAAAEAELADLMGRLGLEDGR